MTRSNSATKTGVKNIIQKTQQRLGKDWGKTGERLGKDWGKTGERTGRRDFSV